MKKYDFIEVDSQYHDLKTKKGREIFLKQNFQVNRAKGISFFCREFENCQETKIYLSELRRQLKDVLEKQYGPTVFSNLLEEGEDINQFFVLAEDLLDKKYPSNITNFAEFTCEKLSEELGLVLNWEKYKAENVQ